VKGCARNKVESLFERDVDEGETTRSERRTFARDRQRVWSYFTSGRKPTDETTEVSEQEAGI